jgi:colanic acid/amylovoran biosynthesis protein
MKTILVRAYTEYNLGDDLFLKILVERYPEVNFRIIANETYAKVFEKNINVSITQIPTFTLQQRIYLKLITLISNSKKDLFLQNYYEKFYRREVLKSDAYLYLGGSLFMQSGKGFNWIDKLNKSIDNIFKDKPKFIIGANFGPFASQSYIKYYKELFVDYYDVCFRDQYSKDLFSELNSVRVCPDVVFQLEIPFIDKEIDSIGFSLIDFSVRKELAEYEVNYLIFVKKIIEENFRMNKKVYLFSFCEKEGDVKVIENVISSLSKEIADNVKVVAYEGNIDEFLIKYGKIESMYCTRFHSMILSSLFKQNMCPIIYSKKMTNVLVDMSYQGVFVNLKEFHKLNIEIVNNKLKDSKLIVDSISTQNSKDCFLRFDHFLNNYL